VEAVEYEVGECDICEQEYELDELIEVGLDVNEMDYDDDERVTVCETGIICKHCSETNFGYSGELTEISIAFVWGWKNVFGFAEGLIVAAFLGGLIGISSGVVLTALTLLGVTIF
jgi:hypothetical protein